MTGPYRHLLIFLFFSRLQNWSANSKGVPPFSLFSFVPFDLEDLQFSLLLFLLIFWNLFLPLRGNTLSRRICILVVRRRLSQYVKSGALISTLELTSTNLRLFLGVFFDMFI
ncbi:hypothetical protein AABB24_034332 [Solanum stoloniferum]|uniref:Uncharacterized protein n=1 Tax=Solanum stoloniferum TaxID=62892 RepID=A0ABD2RF13_9SOLN